MRLRVRMVLLLTGLGAISTGVWLIYLPAGVISLGISLVLLGFITVNSPKSKVE